jgi:tetratricopeptide (TPR) repeat protein
VRGTHRLALVVACAAACAGTARAQQDPWAESYRLEAAGKYAEALAQIEPAANRQPPNELAVLRAGWLLYLQGRLAESDKLYRRAGEANPRSLEARLGLMLPLMAQQRWQDAMRAGRDALAISPWNFTAHLRLMVCEEATSRWDELARHAAEVAARYPSDANALVYWARAESALNNARKARTLYQQVLERIPGHVEATRYLGLGR